MVFPSCPLEPKPFNDTIPNSDHARCVIKLCCQVAVLICLIGLYGRLETAMGYNSVPGLNKSLAITPSVKHSLTP